MFTVGMRESEESIITV